MPNEAPNQRDKNATKLGRRLKTTVLFSLVVVILILGASLKFSQILNPTASLGGSKFHVEIADDNKERARGLSGRHSLKSDEGMLFAFQSPDRQCFWMKGMNFALDILWFDQERRLIHSQYNISPKTYPNVFCSEKDAKYVLELDSGQGKSLDLKNGDLIELNP